MNSKKKLRRNEFQELVIDTKKKEKISKKKADMRWIIKIILIAFTLSFCLSYVSQVALPKLSIFGGVFVTLLFVGIGILFDIVGVAEKFNFSILFTGLFIAAIVAALTIGGKALGKGFAINKSNIILYEFAKVISIFYKVK